MPTRYCATLTCACLLPCVTTIPGIWRDPGTVYPIFRDIQIPGLFDDLVITNSGILKKLGIYFMLILGMNSLMLHCI